MQEIVSTLERNAREVQYGSVGVTLRIHEGQVVKTIYTTSKTKVTRNQTQKNHKEEPNGERDN